jgi:DNA-binding response OmpR family regulator/predicted regulator of Ras-like GTPase activity (Roadblock/LC7/MglB family)
MSNILIEDANEAFATILKECIQSSGAHKVVITHSAKEAWHAFMEGNFELAIVDLGLSDRNPIELLTAMRLAKPELRMIAIPVMGKELPAAIRALGIQGILTKPFFVDDVKPTIEAALSLQGQKIKTGPIAHPASAELPATDKNPEALFTELPESSSSRPANAMHRLSTDELKKVARAASTDELKRIGKANSPDGLPRTLNIPATSELLRNAQPPITGDSRPNGQEPSLADWEAVEEFSALMGLAEKGEGRQEFMPEAGEQGDIAAENNAKPDTPPAEEIRRSTQARGGTGKLGNNRSGRGGTGRLRQPANQEPDPENKNLFPRQDRQVAPPWHSTDQEAAQTDRHTASKPALPKEGSPADGHQKLLDQEIDRLHREMGAEATMLVAEGALLASAGNLPPERTAQLAELLFRSASISNDISNLLNSHQDECKLILQENTHSWLYSLTIEPGILLAIVLSPRVTLGFIRTQAKRAQQTISALL